MVSVRRVAPVLLLIFAIPVLAAAPKKSSTRPPHDLHKVGDHWTAYNPPDPATYAPNARTYTIKAGDTLWGLANEFYKNSYLWPQLWEANTWITDAHWIYPGDVILVEGEVQGAEAPAAPSTALNAGAITPPAETTPPVAAAETTPATPPIPLAVDADLYCYGYIGDPNEAMPNSIASFEDFEMRYHLQVKEQSDHGSTGDFVYIAGGSSTGLVAGDTYMLVDPEEMVVHPGTKNVIGRHYAYVGQVKILCVDDVRARGIISQSCREVPNGARLKPMPQLPIPIARIPDMPTFCDPKTGVKSGMIVSSKGWDMGLGIGDLLQVDLGRDDQVQPGDFFTVYKMSPIAGQGRQILGEIAILTTEAHTATARVVAMRHVMSIGDFVEAR